MCLLKVTKPPESLKIEAKNTKVCFLQQGLIPGFLHERQVSYSLDHESSDKEKLDLDFFLLNISFFGPLLHKSFIVHCTGREPVPHIYCCDDHLNQVFIALKTPKV